MAAKNDLRIYKQVLHKRIASIRRKLANTKRAYVRARLIDQLQETQRLLSER